MLNLNSARSASRSTGRINPTGASALSIAALLIAGASTITGSLIGGKTI